MTTETAPPLRDRLEPPTVPTPSLCPSSSPWRTADFRTLFTATALSQIGTNIGYVTIPLIAISALHASAGQVGMLTALGTAAFLLIGLPAGAWMDRMRQRRVLIAADLSRALLLASVPLAWWLDALSLEQLYVVVLLNGCATVFFDIGSQSILPQLVGRDVLVSANAGMVSLQAAGNVAGRGVGGGLVQLLTAPVALVFMVLGYAGSALRLIGLRGGSARPAGSGRSTCLRAEISAGLRHVFAHGELRALALSAALTNLGTQMINTLLPVLFVHELGLSAGALGLFWAVGGVGVFLGARSAGFLARTLGYGRTLGVSGLVMVPAGALVALIGDGTWLYLAGAGWLLFTFKAGVDNVLAVSLRQQLTPDSLLGRTNATFRFMLTGALSVGSAVAGLIGQLAGMHAALWTGGGVMAIACLPVLLSPVPHRHELPRPETATEGPAQVPAGIVPAD